MDSHTNLRVFVYYNLRKHVWSVKALSGPQKGKVIAHSTEVLLKNAQGKVSEAGRQRVLREKQKNVHAGIVGELISLKPSEFTGTEITYNPYKYTSFVFKANTEQAFTTAPQVYLTNRKVFVEA